jgi:hypothetical protein
LPGVACTWGLCRPSDTANTQVSAPHRAARAPESHNDVTSRCQGTSSREGRTEEGRSTEELIRLDRIIAAVAVVVGIGFALTGWWAFGTIRRTRRPRHNPGYEDVVPLALAELDRAITNNES